MSTVTNDLLFKRGKKLTSGVESDLNSTPFTCFERNNLLRKPNCTIGLKPKEMSCEGGYL